MSFAGKQISDEEIAKNSELGKDRNCVSCGARIKRGHICPCQDEKAMNCPKCKKNIPRTAMRVVGYEGTGKDNLEIRVCCPAPGCIGYLYTYVYLEDFVPLPLL